jgi:CDP-diacylglycerol--glycerol-3-phosphate 3-phosphatidyltransferase
MNLPNKLTLMRVILVPFFVFFFLNAQYVPALIVFALASVTDALDGHIARKHNLVTNFGKFADPLADKMLVAAALIALSSMDKLGTPMLGAWATFIIIAREFMVTGVRLVAAAEGKVIAAGMSGKIKTTIQMITIVYILFSGLFVSMGLPESISNWISNILVVVSVIMTVYSGSEYIIQNKSLLNTNK